MQEGLIDANVPMNYKNERNAKNAREYRNWLAGFRRWRFNRHVYTGLDANQNPESVASQIAAARLYGMEGVVNFSFNQTENRPKLVEVLKSGVFSTPAAVPDMPWKTVAVKQGSRELYAEAINAATIGRDIDKAIDLLNQLLNADPGYTDARFRLGWCYFRKGNYEEAVKKFEEVLAVNPNHPGAKNMIEDARKRLNPTSSAK
jgi:tetratricopeptide (TPR) repeat protein